MLTLLLIAVTALWGWTFVLVQQVVLDPRTGIPVVPFLALRFLLAAAVLAPLALRRIRWTHARAGLGIGFVLAGGYWFQTEGLRFTTPTNSALLTGLFVACTPLWDRLLFGLRPRRDQLLAVLLSLVGMGLLVGQAPVALRVGDLLTVACAVCYGLHISLLSRFGRDADPLALTFFQMLAAGVLFGAMWPLAAPLAMPHRAVWPTILIMGVLASALAFYIQTRVQSRLPAVRTAIILSTEPLFGAFFGYWLAGDRLRAVQIAGAVLIVSAIVVAEIWPRLRQTTVP